MPDTTEKVALVTGANKGIGKETARQLAERGYVVYLGARDVTRGMAAAAELRTASNLDVRFIEVDVTNPSTIDAAAKKLMGEVSGLDLLINNAGIIVGMEPPSTVDLMAIRTSYETNVIGPIALTQALLPLLRAGTEKVVVNISSELGSLSLNTYPGFPYAGLNAFAYNSSKTALNAFTVLLAKELQGEGFRVNSVNPGYTATDLNGNSGTLTVTQAVETILRYATLTADGPTGGFFTDGGVVPW